MAGDGDIGFNYQQWTKNTVLTLTNVRFNNAYDHAVRMGTREQFDAYLDGRPNTVIDKFSLAKFEHDVTVNTPFNRASKFNYLRAVNDISPDDISRTYYYFVTNVEYVSPKATRLRLQLDVWTTYIYDTTFGRGFLERGHMGIANTNQFDQYGRSYLTVSEGLDVGSEYRTVHVEFQRIIDAAGDADTDPGYDVLVCSTLDLTQDPGDISDPAIDSATGGTWQGLPTGADFYIFPTGYDLRTFMAKYSSKPWITQSIISITLIPNMKRYNPGYDYGDNLGDSTFKMYRASVSGGTAFRPNPKSVKNLTAWRDQNFIEHILGDSYKGLRKFLTYPYMLIELTTFTGSPVLLRPEAWQDPDAKITELAAFMPPGQRILAYPARYNADAETLSSTQVDQIDADNTQPIDDFGDSLNIAVTLDDFPSLPIVNNMAIAFLAQNRNGLAFSFQNAGWGRERSIAGAQVGADVASAQIGNTARQSGIAIQNATQQAAISTNAGMAGSVVRAAANGVGSNVVGGAAGLIDGGISASAQLESLNASNSARGASAVSDIQTSGQVRDTNQQFANFAAQGDYENNVRGIQARIQDAALTQPSVSGQFGGDTFNLINGLFGYALRWKMLNLQALRQIGNHWLRYGYAVHQYVIPPVTLRCMEKFTYWKFTDPTILDADMPETFKQTLRGILQNGVTVWSNPDDIGQVALDDNDPLPGISY